MFKGDNDGDFFTQGPTVDMDEKVFTLIADVECLRCLYGGT